MAATRSFPALGFDPAPGDADAVQKAADAFTSCGKSVSEAHDTASGLSVGTWTGQAADSASHQFGQLGQSIGDQNTALSGASKALGQWASDLKGFQSKAATLESEAEAAKQKLTTAQSSPDLKLAGQTFSNQADGQAAQSKYQAATSGVKSAQSALDGIKQQAKTLLGQHDQAAQAVAKQLTAESTGLGKESPAQPDNSEDPGQKTVDAARSQIGKPYAWGGGGANGASLGHDDYPGGPATEAGDKNKTGFDCSGLSEYAVKQGTGQDIGHFTGDQVNNLRNDGALLPSGTSTSQLQPGDLIYFNNDSKGNPGHVVIYAGNGNVVEAPSSGPSNDPAHQVHQVPLSQVESSEGQPTYLARPSLIKK